MAIYKRKTVRCCSETVKYISIGAMILGFLVIIFGSIMSGYLPKSIENKINLSISQSGYGAAVIVLGIVTLLVGCLGYTTGRVRGCMLGSIFIFASFAMGVAFLIIGIVMAGLIGQETLIDLRDQACLNYGSDIGPAYLEAVDKNMCSLECPCDKGDGKNIQDLWESYDDMYLR
jgi:hypothetical protein